MWMNDAIRGHNILCVSFSNTRTEDHERDVLILYVSPCPVRPDSKAAWMNNSEPQHKYQ